MDKPTTETSEKDDAATEAATTEETEAEAEESEESTSTGQIDYEGDLEAERKRGKPDPKKAKDSFEKRKEKRDGQEEGAVADDDDKPMTRKEAAEFFRQQSQQVQKEANRERITEIAHDLAESDKEAELIVEIHKNRTFPDSLSLKEQVEECWAIANRKRIAAKTVELARAVQGKGNASKDAASTHRDPQKGTEPSVSGADKASFKRAGFAWNATTRRYEKKLPNGKTLVKEPGRTPYLAS